MLEYGDGFGAKFFDAGAESGEFLVVFTVATVAESFGSVPTILDIGFGNIEEQDGFDFVARLFGGGHNGIFFAGPAADRGKNQGDVCKVLAIKIGQNPFEKGVGGDKIALTSEVAMEFSFFSADNDAGGE